MLARSRPGAAHAHAYQLADAFHRATGGCVSIGRSSGNTISMLQELQDLPSNVVMILSRQHVLLEVRDGQLNVADNDTVNGTFVNGQRIPAGIWRVLNDGDVVSCGG